MGVATCPTQRLLLPQGNYTYELCKSRYLANLFVFFAMLVRDTNPIQCETSAMINRPSAFVIMPFDEELSPVYEQFIRPVLEHEGFAVERADDIESQRNILKDIINKINSSDLIVADLTDLNPNVFYELGIAHALRKKVLLLTQAVEDIPFDLKSYRHMEYSTHFATFEDAKGKLKSYAQGCREGTIDFESPVTDFLPTSVEPPSTMTTEVTNVQIAPSERHEGVATNEPPAGFLDHQIALAEGNDRISDILAEVTTEMLTLTQHVEQATSETNKITSNPNTSSARAARNVFRRLAAKVNGFTLKLKMANSEYEDVLNDTEGSLEQVVIFLLENPSISEAEWDRFNSQLGSLESPAAKAKDACLDFATAMDELPRIERRLNRAVAMGSEELRVMAGNLDRTAASVERARQRINEPAD